VTRIGLEGGAVYALSSSLRDTIKQDGSAILSIDLRPGIDAGNLEASLSRPREKQSLSNVLRKTAKLPPVAIGLLHEAARQEGKLLASATPAELGALIKDLPLRLTATAPIERAISSAGGVAFEELDGSFMLRRKPGVFIAGEMLDWEAPTGGYLLQGCFSTGAAAARGALVWLGSRPGD
jgi:predicted flavoprotein YhiN